MIDLPRARAPAGLSMLGILGQYIASFYRTGRFRLLQSILLMVVLGLLEGIGVIMLIPFLSLVGITPAGAAAPTGVFALVDRLSAHVSPNLPAVLIVYSVLVISQSALQRRQGILTAQLQQGFVTALRNRLYGALLYAKWSYLLEKRQSDVAHMLTCELPRVGAGTYSFLQLMVTGVVSLMQIGLAYWVAPLITLFTLASGSVLFVFLNRLVRQSRQAGQDLMGFHREIYAEMNECLNGMKEIKNHALEERHVEKFGDLSRGVEGSILSLTRIQTRTEMFYKSGAALVVSLYFYVAVGVLEMAPAQLLVIVVIFSRLWPRFSSFQRGLQQTAGMLPAFAGLTRIFEEALAEREAVERSDGRRRFCLKNGVEFAGVCFRYRGSEETPYTIDEASFVVPAFKMTAFSGSSGAGKSTLADLLTGLLKPDRGAILVDGRPLTSTDLQAWRNSIGYVPQEPFLLHKSIRENLLWATPEAAENEIWEALRLAAAEEFVRRLPEGLDTVIGDRGVRLSGGERQRIVLARALLRKPSLLILDEATSALDGENEKRIQEALGHLQGKLTIVVIAHRLSTIRKADHAIVLERGRVVENETWEELTGGHSRPAQTRRGADRSAPLPITVDR